MVKPIDFTIFTLNYALLFTSPLQIENDFHCLHVDIFNLETLATELSIKV